MSRIISTIVCSLLMLGSFAQGLDSTMALAQRLFKQNQFEQAIYFYERARFFSPQELEAPILFKMGECYRQSDQAETSLAYFDRAYFNSQDEKLKQEALLAKVQSLIQLKDFNLALAEIYAANPQEPLLQQRFHFYEGLCHYTQMNFEQSYHSFIAAAGADSNKVKELVSLYSDTSALFRPRPGLAKKLSFFLPGLGQFYAGDYRNGFNSLALNAAFIALTINVGLTYSTFDALLAVFPWLQRYYIGGTDKAKLIAKNKLLKNRQEFFLEVLEILENEKATASPGP